MRHVVDFFTAALCQRGAGGSVYLKTSEPHQALLNQKPKNAPTDARSFWGIYAFLPRRT